MSLITPVVESKEAHPQLLAKARARLRPHRPNPRPNLAQVLAQANNSKEDCPEKDLRSKRKRLDS